VTGSNAKPFSLPDWAFYPFAALLGGVMTAVAFTARPPEAVPEMTDTTFLLEGLALNEVFPGPGTRVDFIPRSDSGAVIRLSASETVETGSRLFPGVGIPLPAAFEARAIGQRVYVELEVRRVDGDLEEVQIGYFTDSSGTSGWKPRPVTDRYAPITLEWTVPATAVADGREWIGLWPDPEGEDRAIFVRRVEARILEPVSPHILEDAGP